MSSDSHYGIKDAEFNFGFSEQQWLTSNEAINRINLATLALIYPNELILNESSKLVDLILLAKYRNKYGNLKLKSVLYSQLTHQQASSLARIQILNLPKDSYYWCKVENSLIPKFALRAGYDHLAKQFSYIGRTRVSSLFTNQAADMIKYNLVGSLTHIYEYIPAIVLQLHDLSFLDEKFLNSYTANQNNIDNNASSSSSTTTNRQSESFWSRLRLAIKNKNSQNMDFNFISTNYEVLCLKKQPASLKQLCVLKLNTIGEEFMSNELNCRHAYLNLYKSLNTLPNSIRNLLWPSYLLAGQCIVKNGKLRSTNGEYEVYLSPQGSLKFSRLFMSDNDYVNLVREVTTYEKNVESLLVSSSGVFLIYDNNQPMRKPNIMYKNVLMGSFFLELNDNGYLRVILLNRKTIINILNLNEFFYKPIKHVNSVTSSSLDLTSTTTSSSILSSTSTSQITSDKTNSIHGISAIHLDSLRSSINVRLALADLLNLVDLPVKLIKLIIPLVYSLVQNLVNRLRQAQTI